MSVSSLSESEADYVHMPGANSHSSSPAPPHGDRQHKRGKNGGAYQSDTYPPPGRQSDQYQPAPGPGRQSDPYQAPGRPTDPYAPPRRPDDDDDDDEEDGEQRTHQHQPPRATGRHGQEEDEDQRSRYSSQPSSIMKSALRNSSNSPNGRQMGQPQMVQSHTRRGSSGPLVGAPPGIGAPHGGMLVKGSRPSSIAPHANQDLDAGYQDIPQNNRQRAQTMGPGISRSVSRGVPSVQMPLSDEPRQSFGYGDGQNTLSSKRRRGATDVDPMGTYQPMPPIATHNTANFGGVSDLGIGKLSIAAGEDSEDEDEDFQEGYPRRQQSRDNANPGLMMNGLGPGSRPVMGHDRRSSGSSNSFGISPATITPNGTHYIPASPPQGGVVVNGGRVVYAESQSRYINTHPRGYGQPSHYIQPRRSSLQSYAPPLQPQVYRSMMVGDGGQRPLYGGPDRVRADRYSLPAPQQQWYGQQPGQYKTVNLQQEISVFLPPRAAPVPFNGGFGGGMQGGYHGQPTAFPPYY
ncbi:hypothetical protein FRB95_006471 [Tulasnella sp. JGI-2019a]|nr:hypothetical protein FRB95_006471 [Tulasnella sp. JGI-2019a]